MNYTLSHLLKTLVDQGGSDLHISPGSPPRIRIDGLLVPLQVAPLTSEESQHLCFSALSKTQRTIFDQRKELDLAFSVKELARFRANIYFQKNSVSGAFRLIPHAIRTLDDLKLPMFFRELCVLPRGMVLVTGPTGSGKSTTLAAMIDYINETRRDHIITLEDPIEYIHNHKNCVINQRELGDDTESFAMGLRSALRQDPDVVMVGELRDFETITTAISIAETGHLVFGTLHTNGCVPTLNRIIDVFPPHQQNQIRTQLSMTLEAVISQLLIPHAVRGRVLSLELMRSNQAIKALISEGKFNQIYSFIQSGQAGTGMQTMNQSLYKLFEERKITRQMALSKSSDPEELMQMMSPGANVKGKNKLQGAS